MSETTDLIDGASTAPSDEAAAAAGTAPRSRRRGSGLSGMLLPELQRLAGELGIPGTGKMRKSDLVAAISERQVGGSDGAVAAPAPRTEETPSAPLEAPVSGGANGTPVTPPTATGPATDTPAAEPAAAAETAPTGRRRRGASRPAGAPTADAAVETPAVDASVAAAEPAVEAPAGWECLPMGVDHTGVRVGPTPAG